MYKFQDPNGIATSDVFNPSDNMKVNGQYLNHLINGYQHLYVGGRSLVERDIDFVSVPGRPGVITKNRRIKEREIEIFFKLTAETSLVLRDKFAVLNSHLSDKLILEFDDEKGWEYEAYLTKVNIPAEQSLTVMASFVLLCPNPFKRKKKQSSTTGQISLLHASKMLPDKIIVEVTKTSQHVEILNGRGRIALTGHYTQGSQIVVEFTDDEVMIKYQERNILSELDFFSVLEDFYIKNNDVITAVNGRVTLVEWRDERL